jgi:D-3-phosphoglycerate dehydrogenase
VNKPVVLIAEELSPATIEELGPDFEIRHCDGANRAELLSAIVDVDALLVRSATKVDAEAITAAKNLKVIARAGVGLDNVDVPAATQAGVMVVNAPTSNITSAAELAIGLLLATARNIAVADASLKSGEWKRTKFTGAELADKTLGIVGFGRIGNLVAQRMAPFGLKLIAYDPYVQPGRAATAGVRMVGLDELLAESDFITVHLPKSAETIGLLGDDAFRKVKPNLRIVNTSRGGIIDESALAEAIKDGRVAGAGLDVFATEPCTESPLFALEGVVVTPHLGASTDEAQEKAGVAVARSVRLALAGELVPDAVNVQGGVIAEPVRPLLALTENLGRIACALAPSPIDGLEVEVCGEVKEHDVSILELSALKGLFSALVEDPVSYVNAPGLATERGVKSSISTCDDTADHRSLVRVTVTTTQGDRVRVAGTTVPPGETQKLVELDEFDIDVPISDHMAFFRYHDRPGVVGTMGQILGRAEINIGGMQVSRDAAGGQALVALTVDTSVTQSIVDEIISAIGADGGRQVDLVD